MVSCLEPQQRPTASSSRRQLSKAEQGLFFTRIRRQAKWAYVVLAVLFFFVFERLFLVSLPKSIFFVNGLPF